MFKNSTLSMGEDRNPAGSDSGLSGASLGILRNLQPLSAYRPRRVWISPKNYLSKIDRDTGEVLEAPGFIL
jgi:hypothetical protein